MVRQTSQCSPRSVPLITFCVPHAFHNLHQLPLRTRYLKQSTYSNGSPFSLACIRIPFPYLEHLVTLLLPTFTLNFIFRILYQTHSIIIIIIISIDFDFFRCLSVTSYMWLAGDERPRFLMSWPVNPLYLFRTIPLLTRCQRHIFLTVQI